MKLQSELKNLILGLVVIGILATAFLIYYYSKPKPELIDYTETSIVGTSKYLNSIYVKNNGPNGWITIYVKYQYLESTHVQTSKLSEGEIWTKIEILNGETKCWQWEFPHHISIVDIRFRTLW